ncbi:transposase family protein [Streptomyces sp. NPDC015346]|uniref:transposase family protein n=1 Tax=Streptomyces sp. NPDC015346 TaxID=3364954 RepID=UPI0036FD7525
MSAARPGRTHDNTAARHDRILAHLRAAGLGALADLGFRGLDNDVLDPVIVTGFHASRTPKLTPGQKEANRLLAVGRAPVEHGFARPKNWRILTKLRTDPRPRHPTPARSARPDEPRNQPLTNGLRRSLRPRPARVPRNTVTPALLTWDLQVGGGSVDDIVREWTASPGTMPCIHSVRTRRISP